MPAAGRSNAPSGELFDVEAWYNAAGELRYDSDFGAGSDLLKLRVDRPLAELIADQAGLSREAI